MKFLLLSFLAGLVAAFGFEPLGLWPLTLLAFASLLRLIERAPSLRSALARGYWFGVGNFVLGLNWIATAFTYQAAMPVWLGWVAVVLLSFYLAVYPAMAAGLTWRYGRLQPLRLTLIFAAAWIVTEWLRATMFTGFAWNPIGVSLLPTPASWLATWIGTYGLSGVAMLFAGALLLLFLRKWRDAGALLGMLILGIALAAAMRGPPLAAPEVPVRIVQPNIDQRDKWREDFEEENLRRHAALSIRGGIQPRLLLWPEVAITWPMHDERSHPMAQAATRGVRGSVARLIAPGGLLLTGGTAYRSADAVSVTGVANSVFALNEMGAIVGRYDKAHLTPYGEYLPMRPLLSAIGLSQLAPGGDTDPGPGPRTLGLPLVGAVGVQICYEIIFSGEVVDRDNRPGFLYNPSNDAWFGSWGPPQHLAQARLRALEEGLPVLRSTPTGISAVIDAEGRLVRSLPWRTAGVIDARLPAPKAPTLFARAGNILPFLFALLLVGIAVAVRPKAR
jgi:apolipoprotein N-acyltransferase